MKTTGGDKTGGDTKQDDLHLKITDREKKYLDMSG